MNTYDKRRKAKQCVACAKSDNRTREGYIRCQPCADSFNAYQNAKSAERPPRMCRRCDAVPLTKGFNYCPECKEKNKRDSWARENAKRKTTVDVRAITKAKLSPVAVLSKLVLSEAQGIDLNRRKAPK